MTRLELIFLLCVAVAGSVGVWLEVWMPPPAPPHGLIICHADGTTFVGHIDVRGISQADLSNAVQMMCKFRERFGV